MHVDSTKIRRTNEGLEIIVQSLREVPHRELTFTLSVSDKGLGDLAEVNDYVALSMDSTHETRNEVLKRLSLDIEMLCNRSLADEFEKCVGLK